ncbi:MAG: hypothetical protein K2Y71_17590 [Xanthobacteraceae bacterium]|nr:hypothetical protein [Xanthobacteraceae bacterium]
MTGLPRGWNLLELREFHSRSTEVAMNKGSEKLLRDEAEMRAFYLSVGISPETTEAAIRARHSKSEAEDVSEPPAKARKRKAGVVKK